MFNPVKASKNIKDEFVSYISTSFSFADKNLREQFCKELELKIANGPWLEINDIFKTGKSINQLIDLGVLSPLYRDLESKKPNSRLYKKNLPLDRPLYLHQEKAIRTIESGNNAVVSTGTGSGKTNCFLIPVLNELLREIENDTLGPGVRALFIYPMNALANDQMKNLRKILMFYPKITFGVYNGGTENNEEDAISVYESMFATEPIPELRHRLPNELLSRDEMKNNPPNILFTNYAMLEHLLFRPKDDVLFSKSDFRFVVLDEAHVYAGATGIETSILLRRLKARITSTKETQFILTSATLGNGKNSDDDIIKFAENLCGEKFNKDNIIRAERQSFIPSDTQKKYPKELIVDLANEQNKVSDVLKSYGFKSDDSLSENELLYDFVVDSELYNTMRANIEKVCTVQDVQSLLNLDSNTATAFISLCTRAQKNNKSLVDARYHYFIRSLEGCYLSLNGKLFLTRQKTCYENNSQYAVFEIAVCDECGKYSIVGKIDNNHLEQVGKLDESVEYFYLTQDNNDEIEEETDEKTKKEYYYLCPHCGAIVEENRIKNLPCDCNKNDYIKIIKANQLKLGARCGNCHRGVYKRLYLGNDAATSVLATALYEELPEITYEEDEIDTKTSTNIFTNAVLANKKKAKKTGRQFLAFSDSRQEAAKFACYLSKSYNEFLRRRGICQIIKENSNLIIENSFTISDFVKKLTAYFSNKRSFAQSNSDISNLTAVSNKNAWVAMLNELARFNSSTSLMSLGVLQFTYLGINDEIINAISQKYDTDNDCVKNLLNLLIFEIIKTGAVCTDSDTDIDDNDREYIFYTPSQRFISKEEQVSPKTTISSWMPKHKNGKENDYFRTNKLYYVTHFLKIDNNCAIEFLDQFFDYLTKPECGNEYCMVDKNKDGTYVLPAKYLQVKIANDPTIKWYKCTKCGKVSPYNMVGKCTTVKCEEQVIAIEPQKLREDNHFAKLYFSDKMSPLFIKEHTAQLSKKESATYQEEFIKKEINALSCSTTFEMGVDVGDLETVFLRDVPPLPSNYAQRAGRAGRSVNAAAYALTFAKLSSHDLSFFREPNKMISGIILPPLFKVDNEKIVRRHIYAISLSMFFADHPDLYDHNNSDKFINEKNYQLFIDWLKSKPNRLTDMLKRSIPDVNGLHNRLGLQTFQWLDSFIGEEGSFTLLLREYENNIKEFEESIKKYKKDDLEKATRCERKLKNYKNNKLIDFLARGNILPRYGFPVDTVELEQNTTAGNLNKLRLSRDLSIAIAEYAPSSEIVADGKLYTSRYIKKTNIGNNHKEWYTAYVGICNNPECQCVNYSVVPIPETGVKCSSCGNLLFPRDYNESIEPRSGFMTEREAKEVPLSRQEKNYKSDDYYIGNTESKTIEKRSFLYNDIKVTIESTTNDSLMVKSSNNFYVCPRCGFAYAEDENIVDDKEANKDKKHKKHKIYTTNKHESSYGQFKCECQELYRYSLHHTFNTDVVKISFDCNTSDYNTMISTMYAILYAISKGMNIERKDIKACLSLKIIQGKLNYSIIIYDAVPGGAGHSRRLVTEDGMVLYKIMKSALNNMESCNCNPSCYNCLRSYENQKIHEMLDRNLAAKFLKQFIGNVKKSD